MSNDQRTENRFGKAKNIACEIIDESRVQLMMKFRFLDVAIWKMDLRAVLAQGRYALATDGSNVYFEPYTVIGRFDAGFEEMVRDYLHLLMHCLFRHPYDTTRGMTAAWWLACDVIAENAAMELCGARFASPLDSERSAAIDELTSLCAGKLTPGNLYGLFARSLRAQRRGDDEVVTAARLNEYHSLFERDSHEPWPANRLSLLPGTPGPDKTSSEEQDERSESDGRDMTPDSGAEQADEQGQEIWNQKAAVKPEFSEDEGHSVNSGDGEEGASSDAEDAGDDDAGEADRDEGPERDEAEDAEGVDEQHESQEEREWREIAKRVEMDLETFSKDWGCDAGGFMTSLSIANRRKYDYTDFLRRFAMLSEEMKINDDEFDYVFYMYGLKLYGNMPLIEPLEYKETQRIRDFAICIDTSESCKGELVKKFVEHTFGILKQQEDYAHAVNIHVIQCDARVQSDMKISDLRDVERFMSEFAVRGMGGTDFRPAFGYVGSLVDAGEFDDLKGLIYFTDGFGRFPEVPPDYDVAFVFIDEGDNHLPSVPPWAMRVLIDEEDVNRFESANR